MLEEILVSREKLSKDYLDSKKEEIFSIIPELKNEEGFDQKSDWHIYDVWEHTEEALCNSNCDYEERVALLLHDIGKPFSYQDDGDVRHFKGHAEKSAEISKDILKRLGFDINKANRILFLIRNHSTIIDLSNINERNIELYQKLLNVQYCDTKAYNPSKIEPVLQRLNKIQEGLNEISERFSKDSNEER